MSMRALKATITRTAVATTMSKATTDVQCSGCVTFAYIVANIFINNFFMNGTTKRHATDGSTDSAMYVNFNAFC